MNKKDISKIEDIYINIIEEDKRGHGEMKDLQELIKKGYNQGLYRMKETNDGFLLLSNLDDSKELIHKGERALHYLRRYINKLEALKNK